MKQWPDDLVVVLVRTRNPLNLGAAARAMQNFGAHDLRLVQPFAASFREARSAVGAEALLADAQGFDSLRDAVADCALVVGATAARRRELLQPLVPLPRAAAPIRAALQQQRAALVFGSEKHGLTRADLDHCHWLLHVPTAAAQPSMNLGQAVAVCLWELARDPEAPVATADMRAGSGELERLGDLLLETLEAGGYSHAQTRAGTAAEVRRMLRRMHVTDADTHLLMGMLRKLLWRLRSATEPR